MPNSREQANADVTAAAAATLSRMIRPCSTPSAATCHCYRTLEALVTDPYALAPPYGLVPEPSIPVRPVLTAEQKTAAREEMKAQGGPCIHCGGLHSRACPRVRRVKWDGGKPVEAEYWRDGKWPTDDVLFPDDIAEDEEEGTL